MTDGFSRGFAGTAKEEDQLAANAVADVPPESAEQVATEANAVDMATAPPGQVAPELGAPGVEEMADSSLPGAPGGAEVAEVPAEVEMSPADKHREATWQGRLKKREEELAARAAELDAREAALAAPAQPGEPGDDMAAGAEEAAETPAEEMAEGEPGEAAEAAGLAGFENAPENIKAIVSRYSEDFGPEFVQDMVSLAQYVADSTATGKAGAIEQHLNEFMDGVKGAFNAIHLDQIADAHEDFDKITDSPEFQQYREAQPPEAQAKIDDTIAQGSTRKVIRMLDGFKSWLKTQGGEGAADQIDEAAMQAAAGVRSAGGGAPRVAPAMQAGGNETDRFRRGWQTA